MTHASTDRAPRIALRHLPMAILAMAALLTAGPRLSAQGWEWTYGSQANPEYGKLRVVPVTGTCATPSCCSGTDGYIAVGYTNEDVYVVRTDNNGAKIWEKTYDVTDSGHFDRGESIVELADGSGFAIAGTVDFNNGWISNAFIMKIDCDGGVVWGNTFGGTATYEEGRDIVEAATGDPLFGTAAGDLILCGATDNGQITGVVKSMLIRVNAGGVLLWMQRYSSNQDIYRLHSLTELSPLGGFGVTTTGDIIAVGETTSALMPGAPWAFVLRVNGNTGAVGGAPQGSAIYPTIRVGSVFNSVVELQNPNQRELGTNRPNVVLAGWFRSQMYFVKLSGGDPCLPLAQKLVGALDGSVQVATTIREVQFNSPYSVGAQQWDLAVSGTYTPNASTSSDAVLLTLSPATLVPAGIASRFGGLLSEFGWSVYPVDAVGNRSLGFILCGSSYTDWESDGDPSDLYLVNTDHLGQSGCEGSYPDDDFDTTSRTCIFSQATNTFNGGLDWSPADTERDWGYQVCSGAPKMVSPPTPGEEDLAVAKSLRHILEAHAEDDAMEFVLINAAGREVARLPWSSLRSGGFEEIGRTLTPGIYFAIVHGESWARHYSLMLP